MNEQKIMFHWMNPVNFGAGFFQPTHRGRAEHRDCGDEITIDFLAVDGRIEKASFMGKGCVLCMAGASMLVETLPGKTGEMTDQEMLALYEGVPLPVRMQCCLLPLEAMRNADRICDN